MPVKNLLFILLLGLLPVIVQAQVRDVVGAADHAGINRFPNSSIVDYRQTTDSTYTLVLGRMQRVNGRVTPGNAERLHGRLTRITYEIPSGFPADDVYAHYRQQVMQETEAALFVCQGRDCGSSNFWANDVFGNPILYGPEANQYYLAANTNPGEEESNAYVALYVVTRANRRVYAHLDILEPAAGQTAQIAVTPEAMLMRLQRDASVVVPGISFSANDALLEGSGIDLLAQVLRRDPLLQVYIVGHLRTDDSLELLQQRSLRRAEQVIEGLVAAGIDAGRVQAQGVGPLAPVCSSDFCDQRIELVLQ